MNVWVLFNSNGTHNNKGFRTLLLQTLGSYYILTDRAKRNTFENYVAIGVVQGEKPRGQCYLARKLICYFTQSVCLCIISCIQFQSSSFCNYRCGLALKGDNKQSSRKHLRTKVIPDFHLTYSKNWGKSGVGIKMIQMDNFQFFSIKSYVVDVY